jgi:hypothetical protein
MKIVQVVNAIPALQKLTTQELSIKKLYKISKLLDNLEAEIVFYYKQRDKILAQYCDIVGNQYMPRKEDEDKLEVALKELLDTDIEYEVNEVVLGDNEDIKLSYQDLVMLKGFVRIEGED